jgi:hypothetical protein
MMDRAIVHNEDTAHGWIWVHLLKKFSDEVEEGVAIESPKFNAATDDAVKCECRQYGESGLKLSKKKTVEDFERTWYHGQNATAFALVAPSVPSRTDGMYSFG